MLKKSKYFTYQDVCDYWYYEDNIISDYPHKTSNISGTWFSYVMTEYAVSYDSYSLGSITASEIQAIFYKLMNNVHDRYFYDFCIIKHGELDETITLDRDDVRKFLEKLIEEFNMTAPRYLPLLIQNKNNASNPIRKIESDSENTSRFNDTPQDGGLYSSDPYTTHITESGTHTEVDSGSVVSRLEEMYRNFHSIMKDWCNEFAKLFFKEEQIEYYEKRFN